MSKLLLNNSIGMLYDDKIVIADNRFFYDRIISMDMEEQVNHKFNLTFLLFSTFFFIVAQIKISDVVFFYSFLFLCTIALTLSAVYKKKDYFLIFSFYMGEHLKFKIKSNSKEEVKHFLNAALEAKKRNPNNELSSLV